jgi:hypothetical protein
MPIQLFKQNGTLQFDSEQAVNGVCIGSFNIPAGTSFYKQWPLLAGCQLYVMFSGWMNQENPAGRLAGTSYPGGVPTISLAPNGARRFITVWATGSPGIMNMTGLQALSQYSTVAINPNGRGLNYIGQATFHRNDSWDLNSTYSPGYTGVCYYRINSPVEPVFVVQLDDGWTMSVAGEPVQVAAGVWEIGVTYRPEYINGHYGQPRWWYSYQTQVYCYARPTAQASPTTFAIFDTDGTLAYDLAIPGLLSAQSRCDFSGIGQQVYVPRTSVMGVIGTPNFVNCEKMYDGDNQDGSAGTWTFGFQIGSYRWNGNALRTEASPHSSQSGVGEYSYSTGSFWSPTAAIVVDLSLL